MSATGFTPISLYYTTTASAVPTAGNLVNGELALNISTSDGKLFYKDSAGVVQVLATKASASGSFTNLAYTGTLTGGTGVVNLGSGQFYKDASGLVGIGTSSPNRALTIYRTSSPVLQLIDATTGTTANDGLLLQQVGVDTYIENAEIGFMQFRTSATERMRIDSSGCVGIGVIPNATWATGGTSNLEIGPNTALGGGYLSNLSAGGFIALTQNLVNTTGSVYKYAGSSLGSLFYTQGGTFFWQTAPSGTAGATATLTTRMSLSNTGDLTLSGKVLNSSSRPMVSQTGGVLQTVNTVYSTAFSTTSASDVATGLAVSITPATASSKVLVTVVANARATGIGSNCFVNPTLYRNGTQIINCFAQTGSFGSTDVRGVVAFSYLDSPSSTSAVTYELYINSAFAVSVAINNGAGSSMITAQEISA
jgi:hypothetical protein